MKTNAATAAIHERGLMFLIVGLGNPGARYRSTYHNLGFMVADAFARANKLKFTGRECDAVTAKGRVGGSEVVVAKPQTFMNLSGVSVRKLVAKYCADESELIVVYDDADLPVGRMRLREEGSAGTHNGMRSVVSELGTTSFRRLKIGIANARFAEHGVDIADFVLSRIDYADKKTIEECVETAASALADLASGADIMRVEERINRRKQPR